jgi:hypothetical protein
LVVLFHLKGQRGEGKGLTLRDHITPEDWGKIAGLEKFEETEEDKSIVESCGVITSSSGGWLPPLRELDLPEIPLALFYVVLVGLDSAISSEKWRK